MQISSFTSAAFDTARSTFKGLAEAAVKQPGTAAAEQPDADAAAEQPAAEPAQVKAAEAPKPAKNQRQGVSLDSYA